MKIIGVTGGIGCGKSRVCQQFGPFGIDTYCADDRAKQLYESEPDLLKQVQLHFPEAFQNNILNLKTLGSIVFLDFKKLTVLNNLMYPFILKDFQNWLKQDFYNPHIVLLESAIILDSQLKNMCEDLVYVYAPESVRIERTLKRDNRSIEQIKKIIEFQKKPEDFIAECFFTINNSEDSKNRNNYNKFEKQIIKLHDIFKHLYYNNNLD